MKPLPLILLAAVLSLGAYIFHIAFYQPYVVLPQEDRFFLELHPTREEVMAQFGRPHEQLGPGERFRASGWEPVPTQAAEHSALSFIRIYSGKIYVFFDARRTVTDFVIAER